MQRPKQKLSIAGDAPISFACEAGMVSGGITAKKNDLRLPMSERKSVPSSIHFTTRILILEGMPGVARGFLTLKTHLRCSRTSKIPNENQLKYYITIEIWVSTKNSKAKVKLKVLSEYQFLLQRLRRVPTAL